MKIYHFSERVYHNYFNLRNWLKCDQQKGKKLLILMKSKQYEQEITFH